MIFRKILKNILPYSVVIKIKDARHTFINDYCKYVASGNKFLLNETKSKFENIVSVQGFGYSGSGAVLDLLREYSNCRVLGYVDKEGSKASSKESMAEIDFVRLSGGLFEIENNINSNNIFINDALLNRFVKLIENSVLYRHNELHRDVFLSFFSELIDFSIPNLKKKYYNGHLGSEEGRASIFFLKNCTVDDYRTKCRLFLTSIFNLMYETGNKYLVVDQLFSDLEFDTQKNLQYMPNLKTIVVIRDIRDIYVFAKTNNVEWIPHYNVDIFIKWISKCYKNFDVNSKKYLVIRFEDLIRDYANTVSKLETYLSIDNLYHTKQNLFFDPKYSAKNVGIWMKYTEYSQDLDCITKTLPQYCYNLI